MTWVPTLTAEETVLLLGGLRREWGRKHRGAICVRDWAMGMVMLEAGLRVGELVGLDVGDLLWDGEPVRRLRVRAEIAKRRREREIPVSVRLAGALGECRRVVWADRWDQAASPAWACGPGWRRLTGRQVESIVRAAAMATLGRPVHPHMLRHTFGTRVERVAGIRVAQVLLGHADIRTTQIYCHPNGDDLLRAVNGTGRQGNGLV